MSHASFMLYVCVYRQCWLYSSRTGRTVKCSKDTVRALKEAEMDGFIHLQVSHDPDRKVVLQKGTKFVNVGTKSMLYKQYPTAGKYAGGIVFRRYYGQGEGIGFTAEECVNLCGDVNLDDHIQVFA